MHADEFLDDHGIAFELVDQDRPTHRCKDSAAERGVSETAIVKSIIAAVDGEERHFLLPGNHELAVDASMASDDRVEELTGFEPGTVHPFASELPLVVDETVLEQDRVSFTTGDPERGIVMDTGAFREALEEHGYTVEDVAASPTEEYERYADAYDISVNDARRMQQSDHTAFFEALVEEVDADDAVRYVKFLQRASESRDRSPDDLAVERVAEAIEAGDSAERVKALLVDLLEGRELELDGGGFDLGATVEDVVAANPDAVEDYREGEDEAVNFLVGQVMQRSKGQADPAKAREALVDRLDQR